MKLKLKTCLAIVACSGFAGGAGYAQTPYQTDANTVLLYHFNESAEALTAVDSSGNGRDATYEAGENVQRGVPSINSEMGNAIIPASGLWAGRTYYADLTTPVDGGQSSVLYQTASSSFTIEMWVKFDTLNFDYNASLFTLQTVSEAGVNIDMSLTVIGNNIPAFKGALALGDSQGPNRAFMTTGYTWEIDTWYHVAVSVDKLPNPNEDQSSVKFYINQAGASTTPAPVLEWTIGNLVLSSSTAQRSAEIGNYYGANGEYFFPGTLDELRFSNVVRTEFDTLAVPEPSTLAIFGLGAGVMIVRMLRRNRQC